MTLREEIKLVRDIRDIMCERAAKLRKEIDTEDPKMSCAKAVLLDPLHWTIGLITIQLNKIERQANRL